VEALGRLTLSWLANAIALVVVGALFSGINFDGAGSLLLAAALFGVLNTVVKPILKAITFPFAIITLGIVWYLVAMAMLALTALLVGGFHINGFWTLVEATFVIWLVNLVLDVVPGPWRGTRRD
jgi:putative membrane protein